jgi:hypothetical protein
MGPMDWPVRMAREVREKLRRREEEKHAHLSPEQRLWRRRFSRWWRTAVGFAVTVIALGGAYVVFVATQGGVRAALDAPRAAAPGGGSQAVAEAAALLSLRADDLDSGALFLPDRHRRRIELFKEGAAEAVSAFVEVVARRRPPDSDLDTAAKLLSAPAAEQTVAPAVRNDAAREALRRFNARVGAARGRPAERSAKMLAAMARAAAATCAAHEQAVREAAVLGRFGPADPGAEAAFFRARGAAYAWTRLLTAYGEELPTAIGTPLKPALAEALNPLGVAATFEPRVLFGASPGGVAPNHLERMATDLAAAAAAAKRLDSAAEPG